MEHTVAHSLVVCASVRESAFCACVRTISARAAPLRPIRVIQ